MQEAWISTKILSSFQVNSGFKGNQANWRFE
jgi:hypothetical protein